MGLRGCIPGKGEPRAQRVCHPQIFGGRREECRWKGKWERCSLWKIRPGEGGGRETAYSCCSYLKLIC